MKKRMRKNIFLDKKADNSLMENVVYIIVIAAFFAVMFLFIARAGSQATVVEQIYAKQIALSIDKAKPGTIIELDISKLYEAARKNKISEKEMLKIDSDNNKVQVRLVGGKGYEFMFFNNAKVEWNLKNTEEGEEKLYLEVKK